MIELGGSIKLSGFENLDPATLIVVKKIVGNYAKKMSQESQDFSGLFLELNSENNNFSINATVSKKLGDIDSKSDSTNLFFAMSKALNVVMKKSKK
tara:strand:+ start:643 stop:930 length:288 start_codon:yes stop_codon:yes gene_type:complete